MRKTQFDILLIARRRARMSPTRTIRGRVPGSGPVGLGLGALLAVLVVAGVLAAVFLYASVTANLPSPDRLEELLAPGKGLLAQPTRLYDRGGARVIYTLENPGIPRRWLSLDLTATEHFSPLLVQVFVSADDPTFWRNAGVTWASLTSTVPVTIAEKLVDRLVLDQEPPSWQRALRMRLLAAQITQRYGRAQVLEWYLNSQSFGHLTFGAESAARLYLNKSAANLTLAEAALLVAVEQAPALNPLDAPKAAQERQAVVLDLLLERGAINDKEYLKARAEQLRFAPAPAYPREPAGSFARLVLSELEERIGRERLERGGLRVFTTLDYDLQQDLDCAARAHLLRLQGKTGTPARADGKPCDIAHLLPPQPAPDPALPANLLAGAVALDLQKGEVLAYTGAMDSAGQPQTAVYQPGSLLTPFVALAGFARGYGPASLAWDIPNSLPAGLAGHQNPSGRFHGPVRLRIALANDYLAPIAQLLDTIGPATVWQLAGPLGLTGLDSPSGQRADELIYGGGSASLLEIAQAYATLANGGAQVGSGVSSTENGSARGGLPPVTVQLVQGNDGQVLLVEPGAQSVTVLDAPLAYLAHDVLADEAARKPAPGFRDPLEIGRPSAGKLGWSDEGRQVWTVGYTPQRLAITWLGLPDGETGAKLDPRMAAGLWNALMQTATRGLPLAGWREPRGISHLDVCDPSGLLPTDACPNVVSEIFLNGSEPTETDTLYQKVQINRETGHLATVYTPPALIEEKTFLIPPPEAQSWAEASGLPKPPEGYDAIVSSLPGDHVALASPAPFSFLKGKIQVTGTAAGEGFASYRLMVGQGLNPQSWVQIGESDQRVEGKGGSLGTWDTSGLDGLQALRLQVVREDHRVDTYTVQVTVDNIPPEAEITYPEPGQTVSSGTVALQAEAQDNIGLTRVEFYIDGILVGTRAAGPYTVLWSSRPGKHTFTVKAYDGAGNAGSAKAVEFECK